MILTVKQENIDAKICTFKTDEKDSIHKVYSVSKLELLQLQLVTKYH